MSHQQSSQALALTAYVVAFAAISLMSLVAIAFSRGVYLASFTVVGATAFLLALSGWLVVRNGQLLAAAEERSRGLIDNALVGIFVCEEGKFQFVNQRFAEMLGYLPEELTGTGVLETVHPDHRDMVAQRMRMREAGANVPDRHEVRFLSKSGEAGWADVWVRPVADRVDQSILVNVVDITERKRAEEQLSFEKALLEAQAEASIDGILVVDEAGQILSFNQRFAEMWRITQEILDSKSDELALQCVMGQLVDPQAFLARVEYLYEHQDETSRDEIALTEGRTFDRYSAPVRDADGQYLGRVWYFRDVTEHKRAAEALRASEERFRTLFNGAVDAIFLADPETGILVEANQAAEALSGYSRAELLHMHQSQLHPPGDVERYRHMFARHVEQGSAVGFEAEVRRKDSSSVPIYISAALIEIGGRRLLQGRFVDLSERKEAERQLQASEKKFRTFTEQSLHPVWVIQDGHIVYCNSALALYIGADSPAQVQGMKLSEIVEADNWAEIETALNLVISGRSQGERLVIRFAPLPGEVRWHDVQLGLIEYEGRSAVLANSQDVTELKLLMEELDAERLRDSLTGLYNRRYFSDVFLREVKHSGRYDTPLTLLMLDIDGFKAVNDAFGHAVGDRVLQAVAEVIRQHARGADIPIRFGGDEFLIVMPHTSRAAAEAIPRRLAEALAEYLQARAEAGKLPGETAALVWLSGGAASYHHEANETLDDVLRRADARMYQQKQRNRAWRQHGSKRGDDRQRRVG